MITEIAKLLAAAEKTVVLVGAGLSRESGIPTFRGKEGIWMKGNQNYFPEELATYDSFTKIPDILWKWYKYRREICKAAAPNKGHMALAELEQLLHANNKHFTLITQNVDNLSARAGSLHFYEIHGNIFKMRCSARNSDHEIELHQTPNCTDIPKCTHCGSLMRPHVLWFDEYYTNELFHVDDALRESYRANVLLIVGTTLATTLPYNIVRDAVYRSIPIIEVNPQPELSKVTKWVISDKATTVLPALVQEVKNHFAQTIT